MDISYWQLTQDIDTADLLAMIYSLKNMNIIYNIYRLNIASRQRSNHWLLTIEGQVNVIMRQVSFSNLISLRECNCMLWMNIESHIVVNLGRSWKFYLGLINPVRSTVKHSKPTFTVHIKAWSSILFILIFKS